MVADSGRLVLFFSPYSQNKNDMPGIVRKVEYKGDWEGFFEVAKAVLKVGGSFLYNVDERRGVVIEPDGTEKIGVRVPSLDIIYK